LCVGLAKLAMAITQLLQRCLELFLAAVDQLPEQLLNLLLTGLELLPVLVQLGRLAAAQQHVFPLLHLDLELQVGFIDQLRSPQRPVHQFTIATHAGGQELEAHQGDQQHRRQAAAQQGKNLHSK